MSLWKPDGKMLMTSLWMRVCLGIVFGLVYLENGVRVGRDDVLLA